MVDVSVITPSFNRALLLPRVWNSLLLQQANFEWIVIDDGSVDNTKSVIESYRDPRIRYQAFEKNSGVNAARNAGVRLARGRYVVFLDSDDELYPESLEHMAKTMDTADSHIGIAVFACVSAESGKQLDQLIDGKVLNEYDVVCRNALQDSEKIYVYRKEVFDEFCLPAAFRGCEQIFLYGISKKWKFLTINKPFRIIHRQQDNLSSAQSVVERSSDIAKSFEVLIENHEKLLAAYPAVEFGFLKKALYRYGVASSSDDVIRIYLKIVQRHSIQKILFATCLMLFCLSRPASFEIWRLNRRNKKYAGHR